MFNSDMVLYCMKSLILHGVKPKEIVDPNIRTDFNKLAYLVRLDHGLGENFSVIKEIAEQGEIVTEIVTHFSALEMTDVGNFKSLLFYFGLLSIKGVDMMGRPILHIPNLVVREQLFNFLIQGYARHDIFKLDVNRLRTLFENMSFKGDWKPFVRISSRGHSGAEPDKGVHRRGSSYQRISPRLSKYVPLLSTISGI